MSKSEDAVNKFRFTVYGFGVLKSSLIHLFKISIK